MSAHIYNDMLMLNVDQPKKVDGVRFKVFAMYPEVDHNRVHQFP